MRASSGLGLFLVGSLAAAAAAVGSAASGHEWEPRVAPGTLVTVWVDVDGRRAPLFPAPDGSGRHYLQAREGASYEVGLQNRTSERVGVVLTVDGLNAISGTRDEGRGRMYVLGPWGRATVRGWRTSLREVRRFTFVDEKRSYAARTDQANSRMGWIEARVYRERPRIVERPQAQGDWRERNEAGADNRAGAEAPGSSTARSDEPAPAAPEAKAERSRGSSYPGTGWGSRAHDPVVVVSFDPEASPAECVTLRYEYRDALVALGVLPQPAGSDDRLWERDRGAGGFARPPLR
jgi:hypothetical protein